MKHLLKSAITLIACMTVMVACDDDNEAISGLSVDKTDITVGAEGGSERLTVASDAEWVAIASEPWVMISPANGVGSTECTVAIDSTLVNDLRTATIRFACSGQEPQIVNVNQTGFDKMIYMDEPDVKLEYAAKSADKYYFETKVTTNVAFKVQIEYVSGESEAADIEWLDTENFDVELDRGARPRTAKLRFNWRMNTEPVQRVARIKFVPSNAADVLKEEAVLTVTQEGAPKIEDTRAGDSLALLIIQQRLNTMSNGWDTSENMRNWSNVTLWESTDEGLPCEEAIGRVRSVVYAMFTTKESIPQEVRHLKYVESLTFSSNTNTMLLNIDLGSEICDLPHLKHLSLFSYGLISLPDDFVKLGDSLEELDLSANNFKRVPSILNKENFPKLKVLQLGAMRRWTMSDLRKASNYDATEGIGLHLNLDYDNSIKKLFLWDTLEKLTLSYCYLEGHLPEFVVGEDGVEAYTQADVDAFGGDTIQYLATHQMPKILPNAKMLRLNLNFFTGKLPDWILYHPHLLDWMPELLVFNQMEQGKDSDGNLVHFDNVPQTFDYYYNVFPGYREKYELKEEITED